MEIFEYTAYSKTILADLHTPVEVYMKVRDLYPQSVLMESSDYHDKDNSRSFIGLHPLASFRVAHGGVVASYPDGTTQTKPLPVRSPQCGGLIATDISSFLACFRVKGEGSNFYGLFGYTSFNAVRYFENIDVKDVTMEKNDAPDMLYILYRDIIVFDHFNNQLTLVTLIPSTGSLVWRNTTAKRPTVGTE